jgi:hypothetical protein
LSVFPSFIASYVALCKLSDYVRSEVNNVFQEWGNEEGRTKYEERAGIQRQKNHGDLRIGLDRRAVVHHVLAATAVVLKTRWSPWIWKTGDPLGILRRTASVNWLMEIIG